MTTWRRFSRFTLVGLAGIAVQVGSLWGLSTWTTLHYLPATVAAVAAAVVHNFLWHWRWTWADRSACPSGWARLFVAFAAANGAVSLAGNVVLMAILVGGAAFSPVAANLAAIAACGVLNYWLSDRHVFALRNPIRPSAP